jgi:hypothetical protein
MIEDPLQLLGRLRLGREEYCQRLLTMLILAGPYPRWNSRSRPSERGTQFLRALDALCFGDAAWDGEPLFVDEFDLPKRYEEEAGCAPDDGPCSSLLIPSLLLSGVPPSGVGSRAATA